MIDTVCISNLLVSQVDSFVPPFVTYINYKLCHYCYLHMVMCKKRNNVKRHARTHYRLHIHLSQYSKKYSRPFVIFCYNERLIIARKKNKSSQRENNSYRSFFLLTVLLLCIVVCTINRKKEFKCNVTFSLYITKILVARRKLII